MTNMKYTKIIELKYIPLFLNPDCTTIGSAFLPTFVFGLPSFSKTLK